MSEKENKFEEKPVFEDDIAAVEVILENTPPPEMFIGAMQCFICKAEVIGLPSVSSDWRNFRISEMKNPITEQQDFYVCKKCAPSKVASVESWKSFYLRTVRRIWREHFRRKIEHLTIFIDSGINAFVNKQSNQKTPSGTNLITHKKDLVGGTVQELMFNAYEETLPLIMAAVEQITPSDGKTEFTPTADIDVKELDFFIAMKIDFTSFGGVTCEQLPEKQKALAEKYLPLYQTLEGLVTQAIFAAFAEMERQNTANLRQAFRVNFDNLCFIETFLYKVAVEYKFTFKVIVPAYIAPQNAFLN